MKKNKIVFIVWARNARRSQVFSEKLNAKYYIFRKKTHSKLLSPIIYAYFGIKTIIRLIKEKPKIIFLEYTQPFNATLIMIYCRLFRCKYVLDGHTGPFMNKWSKLPFSILTKKILQNSYITIVHNEELKQKLVSKYHNIRFVCLEDPIPNLRKYYTKAIDNKKNVTNKIVVINSFAKDEPLEEVIKATKKLKNITFYITGDLKKANSKYINAAESNVHFTGFLSEEEYSKTLQESDAIMVLTTRDYTLLCGGYEALSLEKPIITSNKKPLKEYFFKGAVFTNNDTKSIISSTKKVYRNITILRKEITELKITKEIEWNYKLKMLVKELEK